MVAVLAIIAVVIITPQAFKRLRKIYQWYLKNVSPEAAAKKRDQLLDATWNLDQFPDKYPEYNKNSRYKPVKGFNIVYRKDKKGDVQVTDFASPQRKKRKKA